MRKRERIACLLITGPCACGTLTKTVRNSEYVCDRCQRIEQAQERFYNRPARGNSYAEALKPYLEPYRILHKTVAALVDHDELPWRWSYKVSEG